jgi:heme/copper-type cytochrome/quinol oxidase subunit 2
MLEFFIPGIIIVAIGISAVYLFTRSGGRARTWITATPNRIAALGIVILILLWVGVLTYNESNRTDFTPGGATR